MSLQHATAVCPSCRAESTNPDDVPHEAWCPLFMRPVDFPQLDLFAPVKP